MWTHNLEFFKFLQIYYYYSTFMCVSAIINSKRENSTAIMILLIAIGVQEALKWSLPDAYKFSFGGLVPKGVIDFRSFQ